MMWMISDNTAFYPSNAQGVYYSFSMKCRKPKSEFSLAALFYLVFSFSALQLIIIVIAIFEELSVIHAPWGVSYGEDVKWVKFHNPRLRFQQSSKNMKFVAFRLQERCSLLIYLYS